MYFYSCTNLSQLSIGKPIERYIFYKFDKKYEKCGTIGVKYVKKAIFSTEYLKKLHVECDYILFL